MYGQAECLIVGRITADVVLRKTAEGRAYCYFTVAVNNRPITDRQTGAKVEVPADYYDLSANGPAAEIIANRAKKGTIILCWTTPKAQKPREVEKDGKSIVYHDIIFRVQPGRFDLVDSAPGKTEGAAEPTPPGASHAQPTAPTTSPECDYEDDAPDGGGEDSGIDRSLPF